jgi:hypothetical protein
MPCRTFNRPQFRQGTFVLRNGNSQSEEEEMKYFTPDLYARLQVFDDASMNEADAEWEAASTKYEAHLQAQGDAVRPLVDKFQGVLLHDAQVLSIARRGDRFSIVLRKDIPPQDLVTLTYTLASEPFVDKAAVPPERRAAGMWFEYDEFDVIHRGDNPTFEHAILFSNGWEIRLRFHDLQVSLAEPVYLTPFVAESAVAGARLTRTA